MPTFGAPTRSQTRKASATVNRQVRLPPNIGFSGSSASETPAAAAKGASLIGRLREKLTNKVKA